MPTKRASPGVYNTNKTSSRIRLNSLGTLTQIQLIQQIEQVQRQAARFATGNYYSRDPGCVTNMLNKLQWEPLQHRRAKSKVTMLYKIIHHEVEIPIHHLLVTNTRVTRGTQANNIRQISTRVDVYKYSFVPSTITAWNRLPSEARTAPSVDSFRQAIQNLEPVNLARILDRHVFNRF